jgi:hypothetical protein|tara:strand:+ start:1556 stop:2161 length:606 start_codon:yes stop_codon:yes gene_type:complete
MAVPSSGILYLHKIANEKHFDNYDEQSMPTPPYSLYDLVHGGNTNGSGVSYDVTNTNSCLRPDTATPHAMSEWYGYDHDATTGSFSATVTVGRYYDSGSSAYAYGFSNLSIAPGAFGSINNTTFGCYTLTSLYWHPSNVMLMSVTGTSRPNFTGLTVGGFSIGGSSSWTANGINAWRTNYFGSPFGTTVGATIAVTASGIS